MHASPKFSINLLQLRLPPLAHRLAKYRELSLPGFTANMRKAEEVEGLRLFLAPSFSVGYRKPTKLDQAGLVVVRGTPSTFAVLDFIELITLILGHFFATLCRLTYSG